MMRNFVRTIRRRWRLVVATLLVALAGAAAVVTQVTPQYESRARLFVSPAGQTTAQAAPGGDLTQQRVDSYAQLAEGQDMAERVIDLLDLDVEPGELAAKVDASGESDLLLLEVAVTDRDPFRAQEVTQTLAEELTRFVRQLETPQGKKLAPVKATVVDSADLPTRPSFPEPWRTFGLAALVGLLLGIVLAVLRELVDVRVKGPEDVSAVTDTPLLGGIPYDRDAPKLPLITDLTPHTPRVEAYRILRTNLQFVEVDQHHKLLTVTSSVPGEGKTSTASNVALAMQAAGQRTLLVDGDLRRPQLGRLFDLEESVGLTSVLLGRIGLEEAVQVDPTSGLAVLTSGRVPPNPAELLESKAMRDLLTRARATYDAVVIDAPPLLPVTDAAVIAGLTDGAVVVVRQGMVARDELEHALDRLAAAGARALGIALTMVEGKVGRGYGYGYGYGYGPRLTVLESASR